jgi:hypothetical protein
MANVAIQFGYVDPDGTNDAVTISPPANSLGLVESVDVVAALKATGVTPLWVDGLTQALVAELALEMGIPSGTPAGWWGEPTTTKDGVELPPPTLNRAARRAQKKTSHVCKFVFAGVNPKLGDTPVQGGLYRCSCGSSKIVGA